MKLFSFVFFTLVAAYMLKACAMQTPSLEKLTNHNWNSGARFCFFNSDPAIETYQYDEGTYLLRQNKCSHYEAPFIYVLFGEHSVLIQDTGAIKSEAEFPLYNHVLDIIKKVAHSKGKDVNNYSIIVSHSHSHSDHTAADLQFSGKPNVTLIKPSLSAVKDYFGYSKQALQWPIDRSYLELGNRKLTIVPLPGHQTEAIAVYDPQTQWLLTGDSLYPGRLYVKNWQTYSASIERLTGFVNTINVSAIMGTHIEMSKEAGDDYPMGSTYQPDEAALPLPKSQLILLNKLLSEQKSPKLITTDKFIIYPLK